MKVLYVVQHYSGPGAPGGSRPYENARRLVAKGHVVTLLCGRLDRSSEEDVRAAKDVGIDLRQAPVLYSQRYSYLRRLVAFRRYMSWAVAEGRRVERPDVVLASSTPLTVGEVGRRLARHHRVPLVFEVRDLWPEVPITLGALPWAPMRWAAWRMARKVYAASSHVVALSPDMKRVVEGHGVPAERVHVVSNCSDTRFFGTAEAVSLREATRRSRGWGSDLVAIHPGAMGKVNGLDYLLDVGKELDAMGVEDVRIALVGHGGHKESLRARIVAERIRSVSISDPVPKRDMAALLAASDVGLVTVAPKPFLEMNSANKFFDFLASGLPVIVNYGGWQARVLRESGAGHDVDPRRPREAAELLLRLRDDPAGRREAGARARRLAESAYDRDLLVGRLERILEGAVAEGGVRDYIPAGASEGGRRS